MRQRVDSIADALLAYQSGDDPAKNLARFLQADENFLGIILALTNLSQEKFLRILSAERFAQGDFGPEWGKERVFRKLKTDAETGCYSGKIRRNTWQRSGYISWKRSRSCHPFDHRSLCVCYVLEGIICRYVPDRYFTASPKPEVREGWTDARLRSSNSRRLPGCAGANSRQQRRRLFCRPAVQPGQKVHILPRRAFAGRIYRLVRTMAAGTGAGYEANRIYPRPQHPPLADLLRSDPQQTCPLSPLDRLGRHERPIGQNTPACPLRHPVLQQRTQGNKILRNPCPAQKMPRLRLVSEGLRRQKRPDTPFRLSGQRRVDRYSPHPPPQAAG